jgi:hypothetical protein
VGAKVSGTTVWQLRSAVRPDHPHTEIIEEFFMKGFRTHLILAALVCTASLTARAQEFRVFNRSVQVHGSLSQGFAYSNDNNFLTMKTSDGSPAFTDGALNLSTSITDKFHVAAQAYDRKVGQLDDFRPQLDFAYGDYRFVSWFGVRAGQVKTPLGLYNDTQDADFLHTWALLPQGVYPLDLRSTMLSHTGVDIYGRIPLKKAGKLAYAAYAGERSFDNRGGYYIFSSDLGMPITSASGRVTGWDLRWTTPLKGLTLGSSWIDMTQNRDGSYSQAMFPPHTAYKATSAPERTTVGYGDFQRGKWDFAGEYRAEDYWLSILTPSFGNSVFLWNGSNESWFLAGSVHAMKRLSLGVYHSNFHVDVPADPANKATNHIYDEVATARLDLNRFWTVKAEEHFMDGYGDLYSAHGFYERSNPNGFKPRTDMLMLRTSFFF